MTPENVNALNSRLYLSPRETTISQAPPSESLPPEPAPEAPWYNKFGERVVQVLDDPRNAWLGMNPLGRGVKGAIEGAAWLGPMLAAIKYDPKFLAALKNTRGAMATEDAIKLQMARRQLPEQAGEQSLRQGVFFLPEEASPFAKYYTGRGGYGGPARVTAEGEFKNPLMVKAGTGGRAPALAYDEVMGKDAYEKMRSDVLQTVVGYNKRPSEKEVAELLKKYGGDPNMAGPILQHSTKGNQLPYAIQEHIVGSALKGKGYDAVLGYTRTKEGGRLSEVFDLTRSHYPE